MDYVKGKTRNCKFSKNLSEACIVPLFTMYMDMFRAGSVFTLFARLLFCLSLETGKGKMKTTRSCFERLCGDNHFVRWDEPNLIYFEVTGNYFLLDLQGSIMNLKKNLLRC